MNIWISLKVVQNLRPAWRKHGRFLGI